VSDFWFDQSAAFARAWLPAQQLPAYLEQYEQLRRDVVRPKLIVLLDAPAAALVARVRGRGRECEQHLTWEQLNRIRQALREQAGRPDLGPVLHAGSGDQEAVFVEVLAAVRGME
jgi:deoxyadenosine/deoxycytidine kinase